MSKITTHVLDTAQGTPARGLRVTLEEVGAGGEVRRLGSAHTDADGRVRDLLSSDVVLRTGRYRLGFDVGAYFATAGRATFYSIINIDFEVRDSAQHYHVPLLLSPFGYSTYRGS